MGCWNGTCGITKLPISYGDKIAVVILKKNNFHKNIAIYSTDLWTPISPAIYGEYNDYGGIKNINLNDNIWLYLMQYLERNIKISQNVIINEENEEFFKTIYNINKLSNIKINAENLIRQYKLKEICSLIPENIESFINQYICQEVYDNISFVMFHESAYKDLIKSYSNKKDWLMNKKVGEYLHENADKLFNSVIEFETKLSNEIKKINKDIETVKDNNQKEKLKNEIENLIFQFKDVDDIFILNHDNIFVDLFNTTFYDMKPLVIKALKLKNKKIIYDLVDLALINGAFASGRVCWLPTCGAGSQDNSVDIQVNVAKSTQKIAKLLEEKWKEELE
jgi:hypothetical protein